MTNLERSNTSASRAVMQVKKVVPSASGWVLVRLDVPESHGLFVRFRRSDTGRFVPSQILFQSKEAIDSETVRRLPIARIEATVNSQPIREEVMKRLDEPVELRFEDGRLVFQMPPEEAEKRLARARRKRSAKLPADLLSKPRRPDRFYQLVGEAYEQLAAETNRPAAELAEANGVPLTTAHRWVKEARRRGFLPPGQKGRRG